MDLSSIGGPADSGHADKLPTIDDTSSEDRTSDSPAYGQISRASKAILVPTSKRLKKGKC